MQTSMRKKPACKWIGVIIRGEGHHNPRAEYCAGRQSGADWSSASHDATARATELLL